MALVLGLRIYTAALLLFLLMPLDFALSRADLWAQAERLPDTVLALPGADRPLAVRVMLIAAASAAFIPVGMLLVLVRTGVYRVRRGLLCRDGRGVAITAGIFAVSTLVMGAAPVMGAILYRTAGIVAGAAILRWLTRQDADPAARHPRAAWCHGWCLPYLLALLLANRLLSLHWLSLAGAIDQAYPLGLLPLFDYYIVTKAEAAKNIVGHAVMYMPVGVGTVVSRPRTARRATRLRAGRGAVVRGRTGALFPSGPGGRHQCRRAGRAVRVGGGAADADRLVDAGDAGAAVRAGAGARVGQTGDAGGVAGKPAGEVEYF